MRRNLDFYPTPEWATRELLKSVHIDGIVIEPCMGDGAIARVIDGKTVWVYGSDVDRARPACSFYGDAAKRELWDTIKDAMFGEQIHWVVTNPPFNRAAEIVPLAYEYADRGIAMLLRLSYLEPVEDRGTWLHRHPPTKLIILPRISFTGDGKTDSVTCAWMVWEKSIDAETEIIIAENPRFVSTQPENDCEITTEGAAAQLALA